MGSPGGERRTVKRDEMDAAIGEAVDRERRQREGQIRDEINQYHVRLMSLLYQCPDIKTFIEGMRTMAAAQ